MQRQIHIFRVQQMFFLLFPRKQPFSCLIFRKQQKERSDEKTLRTKSSRASRACFFSLFRASEQEGQRQEGGRQRKTARYGKLVWKESLNKKIRLLKSSVHQKKNNFSKSSKKCFKSFLCALQLW